MAEIQITNYTEINHNVDVSKDLAHELSVISIFKSLPTIIKNNIDRYISDLLGEDQYKEVQKTIKSQSSDSKIINLTKEEIFKVLYNEHFKQLEPGVIEKIMISQPHLNRFNSKLSSHKNALLSEDLYEILKTVKEIAQNKAQIEQIKISDKLFKTIENLSNEEKELVFKNVRRNLYSAQNRKNSPGLFSGALDGIKSMLPGGKKEQNLDNTEILNKAVDSFSKLLTIAGMAPMIGGGITFISPAFNLFIALGPELALAHFAYNILGFYPPQKIQYIDPKQRGSTIQKKEPVPRTLSSAEVISSVGNEQSNIRSKL